MKTLRILGLIMIAGFLFSCEKDVEKDQVKQDVVFGISEIDPFNLKDGSDNIICPTDDEGKFIEPEWAHIEIEGFVDPFTPKVFYLNGKLYTQAIKLPTLPEGEKYKITKFVLKAIVNDVETIVMATPEAGSEFGEYVDNPIFIEFEVPAFEKVEVAIEVLCFQPSQHEQFGFFWFNITEIVVREICFFGDLCVKNPLDYTGSTYSEVFDLSAYPFDLPAIFKILAYKKVDGDWVKYDEFTNVGLGDDGNLEFLGTTCAKYPDRPYRTDEFKFILEVLVRVGDGFEYVEFYDGWEFTNAEPLVAIEYDQQVVNFVIGECVYGEFEAPDMKFPAYQNLPKAARVNLEGLVTGTGDNSVYPLNGGYWGVKTLYFIPNTGDDAVPQSGYEFPEINQTAIGWCGDAQRTITAGNHDFEIYSTLFDGGWVGMRPHMTIANFERINWLFNNIHLLKDEDGFNYGYSQLTGLYVASMTMPGEDDDEKRQAAKDLQHAIWLTLGQSVPAGLVGGGTPTPRAIRMSQLAITNGPSFVALPGTYAGVLLVKDNAEAQIIFIIVDP